MTKTFTIRTCHIHIGLWIFATIGLLYSINYMQQILSICNVNTNDYNPCYYYQSSYELFMYFLIALISLIQIVALLSWNKHYKWFTFELKSCWSNNKND